MQISLPRSALFAALGQVKAVVEKRNTIPILSNVLLRAEKDSFTVVATDLDIEIKVRIEGVTPEKAGATTVEAHLLFDIVRKFSDKAVISLATAPDGQKLRVAAERSEFHLQMLPESDYPSITVAPMPDGWLLPAATLARIIAKTEFAISSEETRYYLCGIYWHVRGGADGPMLCAVATDGHRLAKVEITAPPGTEGMPGVIVPTKTVSRLREMAKGFEGDITFEVSDTKIRATAGGTVLTSKLIDATYPDYARVMPRGNDRLLTADRPSLAAALDRVSTLSSDKGRAVVLELEAGTARLAVNNADHGTAEETLDVTYEAEPLRIGFNSRYLADVLDCIACDQVQIRLGDAGNPALITNPLDPSVELVIMPMRV
ncbi:DNA polymerase III, beta subunit [Kaistia soli DSM 19436]|uniref:Beta sliding clamp n=1 Tax=Kaistia soli DSM 19436 TaxID=1122133 RepID=A0A1M4Y5W6_9HYPH|nr:DNA polymerase III subunit beta [Kaistia soli]SHF00973.1 DNA polymerase III, beta subunit [Kaistia soli DSM 19436]